MAKKVNLVVLAAGMASRYGGIKQLDAVGKNGECLLDYSVYDFKTQDTGKVIFIIRPSIEKDFREKIFDKMSQKYECEYVFQTPTSLVPQNLLSYAQEREKPYGTIQAVLTAAKNIDDNFIVINADDFYGRGSYKILTEHFAKKSSNALVGYKLGETLSDTGTVNRGICRFINGKLAKIEETYKIALSGRDIKGFDKQDNEVLLKADDIASMNFFGFNKDVLADMENYWSEFLTTIRENNKSECLLPIFCNQRLSEGKMEFDCYTAVDKWFGMTYKEDREYVKQLISEYTDKGIYPDKLY